MQHLLFGYMQCVQKPAFFFYTWPQLIQGNPPIVGHRRCARVAAAPAINTRPLDIIDSQHVRQNPQGPGVRGRGSQGLRPTAPGGTDPTQHVSIYSRLRPAVQE